ncbi:MAG: exosortase/archaeosortase family protein [Phycisphaerales bacterium]|nr:MAG: exosortase/archaeosortase family protein [Phycisphaerales bacterium]
MANKRIRSRHAPSGPTGHRDGVVGLVVAAGVLVAVALWSYWATIYDLLKEWQRNEDYSAGQLVPLVALIFIWIKRKQFRACSLKPCWWAGVALLLLAQAGRFFGLLFLFESAQRYSLVLTVAGLVLVVAGRQVFRQARWILLFLFLMVPFPGQVHNRISGPLQGMATKGSVFLLEVFVPRVSQRGNVVMLDKNTPMAVAEACSGLRMLTAFIIVAAFIAFMVKRPRWQKAALVLSSIPIAVVCNVVRIFFTALLMLFVSSEVGERFFHDFAGLVMMPVAVMLIFGELWVMDQLVLPDSHQQSGAAKPRGPDIIHAKKSS